MSLLPAFLLYALLCEITPGPVNLYALSCGIGGGGRLLRRLLLGLLAGFGLVMGVSVVFALVLGQMLGRYAEILSYGGAAYILWLAWGMVRARDWGMGEESGEAAFSRGVLLQVTNGKTALFCITTLSTYVLPYTRSPLALLGYGLALPVTGVMCTALWALAGSRLRGIFLRAGRAGRWGMAALLAACAVQLIVQG